MPAPHTYLAGMLCLRSHGRRATRYVDVKLTFSRAPLILPGRFDLPVPFDSVDFSVTRQISGSDDSEYLISRNFTLFPRVVRNVKRMSIAYVKLKKKKDWGIDPEMQALTKGFDTFFDGHRHSCQYGRSEA